MTPPIATLLYSIKFSGTISNNVRAPQYYKTRTADLDRVTRCSDQKVASILAKIAKFVATVKKKNFKHQNIYITASIFGDFWRKKSPKHSVNRQNGNKLSHLVTLDLDVNLLHLKMINALFYRFHLNWN